jgi:hypothetical protein
MNIFKKCLLSFCVCFVGALGAIAASWLVCLAALQFGVKDFLVIMPGRVRGEGIVIHPGASEQAVATQTQTPQYDYYSPDYESTPATGNHVPATLDDKEELCFRWKNKDGKTMVAYVQKDSEGGSPYLQSVPESLTEVPNQRDDGEKSDGTAHLPLDLGLPVNPSPHADIDKQPDESGHHLHLERAEK